MTVTRFAPSPTGFLHIGGARTALFNWLHAKHTGGKFLLRIEDTDLQRSTTEATQAIIDSLTWLGLDWDGPIVMQSARAKRHAEVAWQLLQSGHAYQCYASAEEIENFRQLHPHEKFRSPWRDKAAPIDGRRPTIRLRARLDGETTVIDSVRGKVTIDNCQLDDMILLRSDGAPTYMLAVVVDDHDMGVDTVIRGDDHFTNTFRQNQIYDALNWQKPSYTHIPLIHGEDGRKLSKRHNAVSVMEYQKMGYLPEAMRNYLLRLGWSCGDLELIDTQQAIALFSLQGLGASPARFDINKLNNINAHYIKQLSPASVVGIIADLLPQSKEITSRLLMAAPLLQLRAQTTVQLVEAAHIFVGKTQQLSDDAKIALSDAGDDLLSSIQNACRTLEIWQATTINTMVQHLAAQFATPTPVILKALRALIIGNLKGPSIIEVMTILGRDEVINRMQSCN